MSNNNFKNEMHNNRFDDRNKCIMKTYTFELFDVLLIRQLYNDQCSHVVSS